MEIDFSGIIRAINDFFTVKTMTTAERILIRQKKIYIITLQFTFQVLLNLFWFLSY